MDGMKGDVENTCPLWLEAFFLVTDCTVKQGNKLYAQTCISQLVCASRIDFFRSLGLFSSVQVRVSGSDRTERRLDRSRILGSFEVLLIGGVSSIGPVEFIDGILSMG